MTYQINNYTVYKNTKYLTTVKYYTPLNSIKNKITIKLVDILYIPTRLNITRK